MQANITARARDSMFEHFQKPSLLLVLFVLFAARASYFLVKKYLEYRVRSNSAWQGEVL
jgi:hypothetical protein